MAPLDLGAAAALSLPTAPTNGARAIALTMPTPTFKIVTPAHSFITRYVDVAMRRTDAPAESHELVAVTIMSALAGSKVRLPLAHRAGGVRLVLWAMNVVDSTGGRKTTVNEFGVDVLERVLGPEAIMPWKGSPEAFLQTLQTRDGLAAVLARDEYTGLLGPMKKGGYMAGLAQDLIRAYDGLPITMARTAKMSRKTGERVDDTDRVRDPYLVKMCAATRTAFLEVASVDDVLDGLLARFIFTSGTAEEKPEPAWTDDLETAWQGVVQHAQHFHNRAADVLTVQLTAPVMDLKWQFEKTLKALALSQPRPDVARPVMKRLADTTLKVAALLALERAEAGAAAIEGDDWLAAEQMATRWAATTLALIGDLGRTRFQARCDDVLATITTHPDGIPLRLLYRAHRGLKEKELMEALEALERQGLIHHVVLCGPKGRPGTIYRPGPAPEELA